jgi:hypothetical protein
MFIDLAGVSQLGNEYRLHVLNHLGCDSGRWPSSFGSLTLVVFTRGLLNLGVNIAGAVDVGQLGWEVR